MNSLEINEIKDIQRDMTTRRNKIQNIKGKKAEKLISLLECAKVLSRSNIISERLLSKRVEYYHYMQYVNGRNHARCDNDFFTFRRLKTFGYLNRG